MVLLRIMPRPWVRIMYFKTWQWCTSKDGNVWYLCEAQLPQSFSLDSLCLCCWGQSSRLVGNKLHGSLYLDFLVWLRIANWSETNPSWEIIPSSETNPSWETNCLALSISALWFGSKQLIGGKQTRHPLDMYANRGVAPKLPQVCCFHLLALQSHEDMRMYLEGLPCAWR